VSLVKLSAYQRNTGDQASALASVTEAVGYYRRLDDTNPTVYLPGLAMALNDLSVYQRETEDRAGALASSAEAVGYYRQLADANPAVHLPDLARSLVNLSLRRTDTGDLADALALITEAVARYRELADTNPAVFLSYLAVSLVYLSRRQIDIGDRAAALVSSAEAVEYYRQLAHHDPVVFLPNLADALNSLCAALTKPSDQALDDPAAQQISAAWQHCIDAMPYSAARAELRAAWVGQLSASGEHAQRREQLHRAALEADEAAPADRQHDRGWVVVAMRARKAVRAHVVSSDGDLPVWASAPLPDDHTELVDAFGQAADWPATQAVLDQVRHLLNDPAFRRTLTVLQCLDLEDPAATRLAQLLDDIDRSSIDTVFAARHADHHRRALLDEWMAISTWPESFAFLRRHATALTTDEIRRLLANADVASAGQHHAILDLLAVGIPTERVEAIVTDLDVAESAVFDAIERGDLTTLAVTLNAAPQLRARTITHTVAVLVLRLAADDLDNARDMALDVAEHATTVQRRAHVIRLSALRSRRPDLTALDEVIVIIRPEGTATS
jgi:hypothetical protein